MFKKFFLRIRWFIKMAAVSFCEKQYGMDDTTARAIKLVLKSRIQKITGTDVPDSDVDVVWDFIVLRYVIIERPHDPFATVKRMKKFAEMESKYGRDWKDKMVEEEQKKMPTIEEE